MKLKGPGDEQINQDGDAKRQNEKREFLDFHRVFARAGFGRHDGYSFAQWERIGNGSGVEGTGVTCLKFMVGFAFSLCTQRRRATPDSSSSLRELLVWQEVA